MLDPVEKTVESGKIAMPDNEIHVSWIRTLEQNINLYFIAGAFFTLLRMLFQNNSDPY